MRGKAVLAVEKRGHTGITPAYAGKRYSCKRPHFPMWDHPRICGEKGTRNCCRRSTKGSPPHMRGKAGFPPGTFCHIGITPAYAGKSERVPGLPGSAGDHPRICGEKKSMVIVDGSRSGSPPHMRGKVPLPLCRHDSPWDHPRICGEKNPMKSYCWPW